MSGSGTQHQIIPAHEPALPGTREYLAFLAPFIIGSCQLRCKTRLRIPMFKAQEYLEGISSQDLLKSPARQVKQVSITERDSTLAVEHHRGQVQVAQNLAETLFAAAGHP